MMERERVRLRTGAAGRGRSATLAADTGRTPSLASAPGGGTSDAACGPVDVCIVNPWFHPVLVGPGERFRRYAAGLRARGIRLQVLTIRHAGLPALEEVDGIRIRRIAVGSDSRWQRGTFYYRALGPLLRGDLRPDVLQLFGCTDWHAPLLLLLRSVGIPSLLVHTLLRSGGESDGWRLRRFRRRRLLNLFDSIVTSSGVMSAELHALDLRRPAIEAIPNGVDLQRFRPTQGPEERRKIRRELCLPTESDIVLFVGGILPRKGVDVLLEAWHAVTRERPTARLVLVGSRYEDHEQHASFRRRVDRLVGQLATPESVVFTGSVSNVEEYFRAADLFVFPSLREGMPNVVPEAMATGLPCILTPFRGLPEEFGRPNHEYQLVAREPRALSDAILGLLKNSERRRVLGERGRTWVEHNLDVTASLDRFASVYRRLSRQGRGRR